MSGAAKFWLFAGGAFALAALAWMAFLPVVVEHELRAVTGFDARVAVLAANPFTGRVVVREMTVRNPPRYPAPDFIELREIRADVDAYSWIFTGRMVVNDLDLDAAKIELIRQRGGGSNAGEFMASFSSGGSARPARPVKFLVKRLRIRLDQLVVADNTGPKLDEKAFDLHIDHRYTNVTDANQLLVPDVTRTLYAFGLHHDLGQLLPGDFGRALGDAIDGASDVGAKLRDAGKKTGDYLKGLLDKLEQSSKP